MQPAIILDNVSFAIGKRVLLKNVSFTVNTGEVFSLFGSSGCGKTTLLKAISGLVRPKSGLISVFGIDPANFDSTNRTVATVWQSRALFPHLTVRENIWYGLKFKKNLAIEKEKKYKEIVELLKIDYLQDRSIRKLSGGEEQKVALARALVIEPKVLLLDEPFTGIDRLYKDTLKEDLRELLQAINCTFVFVSHDTDDIYSLSNRIAVIERQGVSQVGTPEILYNSPNSRFIAEAIGNYTIIPGEVNHVNQAYNTAVVRTPIGTYSGSLNGTLISEGQKVFYAIRVDGYTIGNNEGMVMQGKLTGKEIKGGKCRLLFRVDDNITIKLIYNTDTANELLERYMNKDAKTVELSWGTQDALILQY